MERQDLNKMFEEFVNDSWDKNGAYVITDFENIFGINRRLARYYLMKLTDQGVLCQLKYKGNTWYVKREFAQDFKQFRWIGVRVL